MAHNDHGFTAGFFLGATMGAMAALLLAPKSGRELRLELTEEGQRLRGRASERAANIRARGQRAFQETRETARQTASGMKKAARALRKEHAVESPAGGEAQTSAVGQAPEM